MKKNDGTTDALVQGSLFLLSFLVGTNMGIETSVPSLPIMVLIGFGLVAVGLTFASLMESL